MPLNFISSVDELLKVFVESTHPIQFNNGERAYELRPSVIKDLTEKFGFKKPVTIEENKDNFYESCDGSDVSNEHDEIEGDPPEEEQHSPNDQLISA